MRAIEELEEKPGLSAKDVFFIFKRQRRKILSLAALGIVAAVAYAVLFPPRYESQAKLLVRYVLERSAIDAADPGTKSLPSVTGDTIINSEVEILTSEDIAVEVADAIGTDRLVPPGKRAVSKIDAARKIQSGLKAGAPPASKIILVSYKNRDPELAHEVLEEIVNRYFVKHLEVHRASGAFDFVSQQAEQVRERLQRTEEELRALKAEAGIISLAESTATMNEKLGKSQDLYNEAVVEQAEQRARVMALDKTFSNFGADASKILPLNREDAQHYQTLKLRLADARQKELELLAKYTPENRFVKLNDLQIQSMENERHAMELKVPSLASLGPSVKNTNLGSQTDIVAERARLAAMDAKTEALASQLQNIQQSTARLSEISPKIAQLERKKEQEENSYKYLQTSLSKARIDEALDPAKMPNISVVQNPTPALLDTKLFARIVGGLIGGGIALGFGIAFFIELILDRTIKRPLELEACLGIPLLASIPHLSAKESVCLPMRDREHGERKRIEKNSKNRNSSSIRPFFEAVRDRLVLYFELNRMRHKPKLVAITGLNEGAGTSTVAAGLAAALSETGGGKVLLVDMNQDAEAHPFFHGSPAPHLAEALLCDEEGHPETRTLFLATVTPRGDESIPVAKRFHDLMPELKASTFDYIIFDMPPINRTSATMAMAGFMDKILLVVEAEKNERDHVKRAYEELLAAKVDASAVFNKCRFNDPE